MTEDNIKRRISFIFSNKCSNSEELIKKFLQESKIKNLIL